MSQTYYVGFLTSMATNSVRPVQLCRVGSIDYPHSDFLWRILALWVRFFWPVNRSHQSLCRSVTSPSDLKAIFLFHQSFNQYMFPIWRYHCSIPITVRTMLQITVLSSYVCLTVWWEWVLKRGNFTPKVRSHSSVHLLGELLKGVVYLCQHHLNWTVYEPCLVNNAVT